MSREPIGYKVLLLKQGIQECAQASTASLLNFLGIMKTIEQVKAEVPVYVDAKGKLKGTSIGHMASYLIKLDLKVTLHTVDIQVFDQTWKGLSKVELLNNLKARQASLKHPEYDKEGIAAIIEGYRMFLDAGGKMVMPIIDEEYLYNLLIQGPFLAVVSYNFLNQTSKYAWVEGNDKPIQDPVKGKPSTHMIVVNGYKDHQFQIMDPDYEFGGRRWINSSLLVGSIYLAETDFDSLLISVTQSISDMD
jgi:hypothetical protein